MDDDHARPSALSGLWSFIIGATGLVALVVALDPITRREDCPNYGGNGNASAFTNPMWDLYLEMMVPAWVALILLEQALPLTRRNRSRINVAMRAATAVLLALVGSCCLLLPIILKCR